MTEKFKDEVIREFTQACTEAYLENIPTFIEAMNNLIVAISTSLNSMIEEVAELANSLAACLKDFEDTCKIENYHDRRLVHLALHGKNARIRKKNRKRILRKIEKKLY